MYFKLNRWIWCDIWLYYFGGKFLYYVDRILNDCKIWNIENESIGLNRFILVKVKGVFSIFFVFIYC